jgi:23S rRNA (guanine745-N1)-methyltransferase
LICAEGFYEPLLEVIKQEIAKFTVVNKTSRLFILDVGCGEGSHLSWLKNSLQKTSQVQVQGVGLDLAKEGIQLAARLDQDIVWCVADLTDLPFPDDQFNIVLNILSPANYGEFKRVLHKGGLLVKVLPGENYLGELRKILYRDTPRFTYSNEDTLNLFKDNISVPECRQISYKVQVNEDKMEHLLKMTPLLWGTPAGSVDLPQLLGLKELTVDLTVVVGTT